MKKMVKVIIGIGAGLLITGGLLYGGYRKFISPSRGAVKNMKESLALSDVLTKNQAKEDLDYLMDQLEDFHPAWKDDTKNMTSRVEAQYETEVANLSDSMTTLQVWQAASRIIHEMKDAHTRVSLSRLNGEARYQIEADDLTVADIVAVNGEPMEEIRSRFLALWPYELESYGEVRFEKYIVYQEYMELAGVDTTNGITITYLQNGEEQSRHYDAKIYESPKSEYVSSQIDTEHDLGIFTLKECKDSSDYRETLDAFFTQVQEDQITNIVVDLRENNGGWIPAVKEFLTYVDVDLYTYCNDLRTRMGIFWYHEKEKITNQKRDNAFSGQIYVLTSAKTFSAAMDFAMVIMDNQLGTVVGAVPGNLPDSYTVNMKYQLPNSKLKLVVAGAEQSRIDESKSGQVLMPDYEVEASQALDKVYELINK